MAREVEADIVVDVPVEVVYRAWSAFEQYPRFMPHVKRVQRTDASGRRLRWVSRARGVPHEWHAEVTDLVANQRVAWRSLSGRANDGVVVLEPQGEQTRVTLHWTYEPVERADKQRASAVTDDMARTVHADLVHFKRLVETGQRPHVGRPSAWLGAGAAAAALLVSLGVCYAIARRQAPPQHAVRRIEMARTALRRKTDWRKRMAAFARSDRRRRP